MTSYRCFQLTDLFHYNSVNLDPWTETFNLPFYMHYLVQWPDLCTSAVAGSTLASIAGPSASPPQNGPIVLSTGAAHSPTTPATTFPSSRVTGYMIGKAEGESDQWHGHVTALSVAADHRQLGIADRLMQCLEQSSITPYNCYFVDLYVRAANQSAIAMYRKLQYKVYRQVLGYYTQVERGQQISEDAYDMRKALPRDVEKRSEKPHEPLQVQPGPND